MDSRRLSLLGLGLWIASGAEPSVCGANGGCEESDELAALQHTRRSVPAQQSSGGGGYQPPDDNGFNPNTAEWKEMPSTGPGIPMPVEPPQPQEVSNIVTPADWKSPPLPEFKTVTSVNGVLDTVLTVDPMTVDFSGSGLRLTTRVYNNSFAGPLLRIRRSDRLKVNLINKLGTNAPGEGAWPRKEGQMSAQRPYPSETMKYDAGVPVPRDSPRWQNVGQVDPSTHQGSTHMTPHLNNFHQVNTTNLHIHGLHVSPALGQDNVLEVNVYPEGEPGKNSSFLYDYEVSSMHAGGTHWYHAHWHGSSSVQVGGGLAGPIIVDYEEGEVPDSIRNMEETLLLLQEVTADYVGPNAAEMQPDDVQSGCWPWGSNQTFYCALQHRTGLMAFQSKDNLWKVDNMPGYGYKEGEHKPVRNFFTTNGVLMPTKKVRTGDWNYVRIIYGGHNIPIHLVLDGPCEWQLVAKDGILLNEYPRKITKGLWPGPGNRMDVIMRCTKPGMAAIRNADYKNMPYPHSYTRNQTVLFIDVVGPAVAEKPFPGPFTPSRPRYLSDLRYVNTNQIQVPNITNAPICPENTGDDPNHCKQPFNKKMEMTLTPNGPEMYEDHAFNVWMSYDMPGGITKTSGNNMSYIVAPVRYIVNNMTFRHPGHANSYAAEIAMGQVTQMKLGEMDKHTWHMHEVPVQLIDIPCGDLTKDPICDNGSNDKDSSTHCMRGSLKGCNLFNNSDPKDSEYHWGGYFRVGDWHDTVQIAHSEFYDVSYSTQTLPPTNVRFLTDCYSGPLLIHCHVLHHEDNGMMMMLDVLGPDHTFNPKWSNDGIFATAPPHCLAEGATCAPARCATRYPPYGQ